MRFFSLLLVAICVAPTVGGAQAPTHPPIEEIVVTATLRDDATVRELPASIAVLDESTIRTAAVQHFEELAALVPNLNWSGEGSRTRYFQIRGTGELEQYEGAPNASVGFVIDDIDFSALGGIATTFDTERIEVLRGPQGTRYGANALAGLIYVRTAAPPEAPEAHAEALAGSDGASGLGAAAGGPVPGFDTLHYRVALQQYKADGFRHDAFLGRDDTNDRDELTARGKLRWRPAPGWQADLTGMFVDLDDGYDAWAIDPGFTTQSDQPGRDSQRTAAGALRVTGELSDAVTLVSITGYADSNVVVSFDADWGNPQFWAPYEYDFFDQTDRERRTVNQELRFVSGPGGRLFGRADWVAGAYVLDLKETNLHRSFESPDYVEYFSSKADYEATSGALFGESTLPLGERTHVTLGLRGERRDADYHDNQAEGCAAPANDFSPTDRMWGGEFALTHDLAGAATLYVRIARGYRAGGFNPSLACYPGVTPEQKIFSDEHLWNYEAGLRLARGRWRADIDVFWQDRADTQVKVPVQLIEGDPTSFVFFTENADSGRAYGAEASLSWRPVDALTLTAGLGLLDTEVRQFAAEPGFEGHPFPHAPPWTASASALWQRGGGWFARADVAGRDAFYFDYDLSIGDDRKSRAYGIAHLGAGREGEHWRAEVWVRNLFDKNYAVRGFYFGNEPPAFEPTRYVRFGDPRQVGITVNWHWRRSKL